MSAVLKRAMAVLWCEGEKGRGGRLGGDSAAGGVGQTWMPAMAETPSRAPLLYHVLSPALALLRYTHGQEAFK